jgi:fumarate reductase subunit D
MAVVLVVVVVLLLLLGAVLPLALITIDDTGREAVVMTMTVNKRQEKENGVK